MAMASPDFSGDDPPAEVVILPFDFMSRHREACGHGGNETELGAARSLTAVGHHLARQLDLERIIRLFGLRIDAVTRIPDNSFIRGFFWGLGYFYSVLPEARHRLKPALDQLDSQVQAMQTQP